MIKEIVHDNHLKQGGKTPPCFILPLSKLGDFVDFLSNYSYNVINCKFELMFKKPRRVVMNYGNQSKRDKCYKRKSY